VFSYEQIHPDSRITQASFRWHDDGSTCCEQPKEVVDGEVEVQGREGQHTIGAADVKTSIDIQDGIDRSSMGNLHSLGQAGRARCVDHVGQIFWTLDSSKLWDFCLIQTLDTDALHMLWPSNPLIDPRLSQYNLNFSML
jgi:hypothetical protein